MLIPKGYACDDCKAFEAVSIVWCEDLRSDQRCCYLCAHDRCYHPEGQSCSHTADEIYPMKVRQDLKRALAAQLSAPQGTRAYRSISQVRASQSR